MIEAKLKQHGVIESLRRVSICTGEEKEIIDEKWSGLVGMFMEMIGLDARSKKAKSAANASPPVVSVPKGDDSQCHGCKKSRESFSVALLKCAACGSA